MGVSNNELRANPAAQGEALLQRDHMPKRRQPFRHCNDALDHAFADEALPSGSPID
ncbi:hypothetical protein PATSB16_16190 [Pandoraea thiooxydans]|nr:hypothetical protein PATSB16_16190 [Pandoraea thiooxydans]